jgi:hypothetical protein
VRALDRPAPLPSLDLRKLSVPPLVSDATFECHLRAT